jgi:hypothetical protein
MGNAKFFYYPEPHGSFAHPVILDLGEALGEMYSDMITEAVDAISLTGSMSRSVGRMQEIVTIQRDRMVLGFTLCKIIWIVDLLSHLLQMLTRLFVIR